MELLHFDITKSFGRLRLIPTKIGLQMSYYPNVSGEINTESVGTCTIMIPIDKMGDLWTTARAFLYGVESLDTNIVIQRQEGESDVLVKLYRDKPKGAHGTLSGAEVSWLRIVSGRTEEERRRIKLGPRDLLSLELACNAVLVVSTSEK